MIITDLSKLVLTLTVLVSVSTWNASCGGGGGGLLNLGNQVLNQWNEFIEAQKQKQQIYSSAADTLNVFCYIYHTALYSSDMPNGFDWKSAEIWSTCSHIVYAFGGIDSEKPGLKSVEPQLDCGPNDRQQQGGRHDMMRKMNEFKRSYNNAAERTGPPVKLLLSVGGASNNEASKLNEFASDATARRRFARNAAEYVSSYGFDGLDLDWEYPDSEQSLLALVRELWEQFRRRSLLLTLTLPPGVWTARKTYNLASISK